jgi:hypothetical protein
MDSTATIKNNLVKILKQRGLKISDVDHELGENRPLSNFLRSKCDATIKNLMEIARPLNISIDELLIEDFNKTFVNTQLLTDVMDAFFSRLKYAKLGIKKLDLVFEKLDELYEYHLANGLIEVDKNQLKIVTKDLLEANEDE